METSPSRPSWKNLLESGELTRRVNQLARWASPCQLCPRRCLVHRRDGETGYCRADWLPRVASHNAHHGEEPPISGNRGSGTIFFAHCTMRCLFCQNFPISQLGQGRNCTPEELAEAMLDLQRRGVHNINFVTPTHFTHAWIEALAIAGARGFCLPIVYNTSGYERVEVLKQLDGIVDIYLPDAKYSHRERAATFSNAPDFLEHNHAALKEMHRQVGDLQLQPNGLARRGLIIRHLVLPGIEEESIEVLKFIRDAISPTAFVSLMSQYFPAHKAQENPPLDKRISKKKYQRVVEWMENSSLEGWIQPF